MAPSAEEHEPARPADAAELEFLTVRETEPGPRFAAFFEEFWPAYRRWYERDGTRARPSFLECEEALATHMPELRPVWERLCTLAGGGDLPARFLSLYCPPAAIVGCTQAALADPLRPALVRNYDYAPRLCDGLVVLNAWTGTPIIASTDCMWGVLDGMNAHGLAVALAFGGRRAVGPGFAVTLVLRYVLETCRTTDEAVATLSRVPVHMAYNVTVVDRAGAAVTVQVAPDRAPHVDPVPVSTNHQGAIEWPEHARKTCTLGRRARVEALLAAGPSVETLLDAFLAPPLYQRGYREGWGTLYTAVYEPAAGSCTLAWPDRRWRGTFDAFEETVFTVAYEPAASNAVPPAP